MFKEPDLDTFLSEAVNPDTLTYNEIVLETGQNITVYMTPLVRFSDCVRLLKLGVDQEELEMAYPSTFLQISLMSFGKLNNNSFFHQTRHYITWQPQENY